MMSLRIAQTVGIVVAVMAIFMLIALLVRRSQRTKANVVASPAFLGIVALLTLLVAAATLYSTVYTVRPVSPMPTYAVYVPGPGCDDAGGQWVSTNIDGVTAIQCLSTGMELLDTDPGNFYNIAEVFFSWPRHPFGTSYTLQADISFLHSKGVSCAGFTTHRASTPGTTHNGGYALYACSDGTWEIDKLNENEGANNTTLKGCPQCLSPFNINQIEVSVNGKAQSLFVNGVKVWTITDATYIATSQMSLYVLGQSVNGSRSGAVFSNFVYTPMS